MRDWLIYGLLSLQKYDCSFARAQMADLLGAFDGLKERIELLEETGTSPEEKEALRSIPEELKKATEAEKDRYGKRRKDE